MNSFMAIIPYPPLVAPEEFIHKEAEKARDKTSELISSLVNRRRSAILGEQSYRLTSVAKLDEDKVAEVPEFAMTTADNAKPVVATCRRSSSVTVGGYDPTNKIAFVVHFKTADQVKNSGGLIFYNISKLVKTPISSPIQLHLRGEGDEGSKATVEAIKIWMQQWKEDLPMVIASENVLTSLSIDSRTGKVSEFDPISNAKHRDFSESDVMRIKNSVPVPQMSYLEYGSNMNASAQGVLHSERSTRIISAAKLDGDKIVEVLLSEFAITTADDARPIVATYGCCPCVAVGGYDPANKIAFVVHFTTAAQVENSGGLIFYNISKLVKTPISSPIQLHLRGGDYEDSKATVEAIKFWMQQRKEDLPMEIASENVLTSLSIDSRTGKVSEYEPALNTKHRDFSEFDVMQGAFNVFDSKINFVYPQSY